MKRSFVLTNLHNFSSSSGGDGWIFAIRIATAKQKRQKQKEKAHAAQNKCNRTTQMRYKSPSCDFERLNSIWLSKDEQITVELGHDWPHWCRKANSTLSIIYVLVNYYFSYCSRLVKKFGDIYSDLMDDSRCHYTWHCCLQFNHFTCGYWPSYINKLSMKMRWNVPASAWQLNVKPKSENWKPNKNNKTEKRRKI